MLQQTRHYIHELQTVELVINYFSWWNLKCRSVSISHTLKSYPLVQSLMYLNERLRNNLYSSFSNLAPSSAPNNFKVKWSESMSQRSPTNCDPYCSISDINVHLRLAVPAHSETKCIILLIYKVPQMEQIFELLMKDWDQIFAILSIMFLLVLPLYTWYTMAGEMVGWSTRNRVNSS